MDTVGTAAAGPAKPTAGDTPSVGTAAAELTPRFPISVDPNGIPVRATPPGAVGVEDAARLLEPEPHIPDMPEVCSISEVDIPDAAAVAGAAVPITIPPPSKLDVDPNIDDDAVPRVEHAVLLVGVEIAPVASPGAGLTPGDAISVEPSGMPVGETGEPVAAMPSGEVVPTVGVGVTMALTCAIAASPTTSAGKIAAISDNLNSKRARMKLLRRIRQTPSDDLHVESVQPLALTQLNTSLFLLRSAAPGRGASRKPTIMIFAQTRSFSTCSIAQDSGGPGHMKPSTRSSANNGDRYFIAFRITPSM